MNYSGNRLVSAGNAAFEYDAKGRQVMSAYGSGLSTVYNRLDLPQRHTTGDGTVVDYKYAFDGRKLQEKVTAGASVTQRDYSGEFLYEGGVLKKILFDGGYVINGESGPVYMFFLKDHLGSVRAVVSETGGVQQINHYYPYGDLVPNTSNDSSGNRYKYTGKESGDEIGLYDFSARFLHTRFGRFTTIDPLAEKYPGISPYVYCNGNPVNFVDPDGKKLRVPKEYQQPFLMDMKLAFGNKVELFSFDDAGILSIEARNQKFTSGLTSEQKKLFKGLTKVVRSKNITSVVYADEYELTIDNDKATHNILIEFGGGVYSKSDDVIVISPNVGAVEVTKDQFPFKSEIVEQNTTSTLFHEIGERNTHNVHYRGNVIDYENLVRRILKLPQRPYDLNHTNDIETKYQ